MSGSLDLRGVLVPAVTPFMGADEEIDTEGFAGNVRSWARAGVRGIVIAGSSGESVFLDPPERLALLEASLPAMEEGIVLVGAGLESTRATIRLSRAAAERGAHGVFIQPPAFYRPALTPRALRDHYIAVAEASPVPVVVYQVPPRLSTVEIPNDLVVELSAHPNIAGIKDSRGDVELIRELTSAAAPDFQVLVGDGSKLFAALQVGAVGGVLGVANLDPERAVALVRAFEEGREAEAEAIQESLTDLHNRVVGALGVPGLKEGVDRLGGRGGPPRLPLRPLGEEGRSAVAEALSRAGLEMVGVT